MDEHTVVLLYLRRAVEEHANGKNEQSWVCPATVFVQTGIIGTGDICRDLVKDGVVEANGKGYFRAKMEGE